MLIVFDVELSLLQTSFDIVLVELPVHNGIVSDDGLDDDDFDRRSVSHFVVLVLFDCHVEGQLLLEELLLDEEASRRKWLRKVSVFLQSPHHVALQELVLVENIQFPLFLAQITVVEALSAECL